MIFMGFLGAYLAYFKPEIISTLNGVFAAYLVATGWMAVKRNVRNVVLFDKIACVVALLICGLDLYVGFLAVESETGRFHGFPA
ncbi:MAG: hypothetical protein ACI808_000469 [Paraglaciecola sp.]|jgi:hypothetical protein